MEEKGKKKKLKEDKYFQAVGRRKTATAIVRLYEGNKGEVTINNKTPVEYFGGELGFDDFLKPLVLCNKLNEFGIKVKVKGGGKRAQIEAIRLGIARALVKYNSEFRPLLRKEGYLTRDPRQKERKKPGLKRARRAPQWQKR